MEKGNLMSILPERPSFLPMYIYARNFFFPHRFEIILLFLSFFFFFGSLSYRNFASSASFQDSNCFNKYWYITSMVLLWILVHTPRGPTPRNQPARPSVR